MAYTRKQLVTFTSILYLVVVTALSASFLSRANRLSIPISKTLSGFTTALPIVAGLLLEAGYDLTSFEDRRQKHQNPLHRGGTSRPPLVIIANTLIFIYSTVVITLLGTHAAPPSGLICGLKERWTTLYHNKDEGAIKAIQEALSCCGLVTSHDMAWPFPNKKHDAHACEEAFGRTVSCLGPWRGEEQRIAGVLMAVVGLVFVWQFTIIAVPTQRESWLHRVLPNRVSRFIADEEHGDSDNRRAIDYLPNFSHYRDNVAEEVSDEEGEHEQTAQRAIDEGVDRVRNVLPGANHENGQQQQPTIENEWSRN